MGIELGNMAGSSQHASGARNRDVRRKLLDAAGELEPGAAGPKT